MYMYMYFAVSEIIDTDPLFCETFDDTFLTSSFNIILSRSFRFSVNRYDCYDFIITLSFYTEIPWIDRKVSGLTISPIIHVLEH